MMKSFVGGQVMVIKRRKLPAPPQPVDQSHFAQAVMEAQAQSIAQQLENPQPVIAQEQQPMKQGMPPRDPAPVSSVEITMQSVKPKRKKKH